MFRLFQSVRVTQLIDSDLPFGGSRSVERAPAVGDVGMIVDIVPNVNACIVECVDDDGLTIWLASFDESELELGPE
jgi:catabolite regulation protein CreA